MRPWLVVLLFLLVYLGAMLAIHDGQAEVFVSLGEYDGQFNYHIARAPAHAAPHLDVPAYRYQRILLPLLGWLLSAGQAALIPWCLVVINSLALVSSTYGVEALLQQVERSRWFALTYGLFVGLVIAVRLSTAEPLAYGLVVLAIWLYQQQRPAWLLALLLAVFAKETSLIFVAGFVLWFLVQGQWHRAIQTTFSIGFPFLLWQLFLWQWLGAWGIGSGGAEATSFELIPWHGIIRLWTDGSAAVFATQGVYFLGLYVVLPTVWSLYRLWQDRREWSLYSALLLVNALVLLFIPFSTYREYLGTVRILPGLVLMVLLYSAERNLRRPLRYSTCWLILLGLLSVG